MFTLPELPYKYDALEPYIDAKTMEIHHGKHHQAYVDNLNKALEKYPQFVDKNIEDILSDINSIPEEIRQQVLNHGGGHANHSFFWKNLAPNAKEVPGGEFIEAIKTVFGDFDKFKEQFSAKAMGVFGSGWAFLILTPDKKLALKRHSFQNSPLSDGNVPLLAIDVWEHAYYLKYQNRRAEYVEAFWNIVNWGEVEKTFDSASK
ncbi:MAG: Superoxide dismutase [Candidatus Woesebacteria bacterium GW2011_GWA1_37_8]|uniref:Superoxide dismutase n=1 Tax=Candidatus Woesebacteria bacterium GW2011_GWA1_37_8 TaxID=1618546 RepID=A0A0G0I151_9BACT|nr:MAG: Superoxide dismutase [Candidatus Woesebacteria bacterium GW2011_GWA1_37_8]